LSKAELLYYFGRRKILHEQDTQTKSFHEVADTSWPY